jgi:hypothetical protein
MVRNDLRDGLFFDLIQVSEGPICRITMQSVEI